MSLSILVPTHVPTHVPTPALPTPALPTLSLDEGLRALVQPVESVISWPLATIHQVAAGAGLPPGPAWLLALLGLVAIVRLGLLPLVARQVRLAHASARARPALEQITRRYAGRTDPQSQAAQLAELRQARAEHGAGLGCLPALVQAVIYFGLYRLLIDVATGVPGASVGAMTADLVASARGAQLGGVGLASLLGSLGWSPAGVGVAMVAVLAAAISYVTTRWVSLPNLPEVTGDDPAAAAQRVSLRIMPWLGAGGLLASAAFVPAGVVLYWAASNLWTLAQQAVVVRWAPTPGTAAYRAKAARHARNQAG